jgi:hypothetical protein
VKGLAFAYFEMEGESRKVKNFIQKLIDLRASFLKRILRVRHLVSPVSQRTTDPAAGLLILVWTPPRPVR